VKSVLRSFSCSFVFSERLDVVVVPRPVVAIAKAIGLHDGTDRSRSRGDGLDCLRDAGLARCLRLNLRMKRSAVILSAWLPGCVGAQKVEFTASAGVEAVTVAYASEDNIPRTPAPATVEPPAELRLRHRTSRWGFAIPALVGLAAAAAGSALVVSSSSCDGAGCITGAGLGLSLVGLGSLVAIGFGIPALAQKPRTRLDITATSTAGSATSAVWLPVRGGRIHVTPNGVRN
jgi:hypothetical protein